MLLGLIGKKIGMTRIFSKNGKSFPITIINISNNRIIKIKNLINKNYSIIKLSFGINKNIYINKLLYNIYINRKKYIGKIIKEFKIDNNLIKKFNFSNGSTITENIFNINQKLDIKGISIGKGFAGTIKKHGFSSGRASHGNSRAHNVPGSIGMCQDPGKVFKGKKMCGHLGYKKCTIQNLSIIRIDYLRHLIFINGSIPGAKNSILHIYSSIKKK